jgi:hypothetical protein
MYLIPHSARLLRRSVRINVFSKLLSDFGSERVNLRPYLEEEEGGGRRRKTKGRKMKRRKMKRRHRDMCIGASLSQPFNLQVH